MENGILFLGLCERSAFVPDGGTNLFKWNILGLKHRVASYIFPVSLDGWNLALAVNCSSSLRYELRLFDEDDAEFGQIHIGDMGGDQEKVVAEGAIQTAEERHEAIGFRPPPDNGWMFLSFPLRQTKGPLLRPGKYTFKVIQGDKAIPIGQIEFYQVDAPPLTPERVAAIKSDPHAIKLVSVQLVCPICSKQLKAYAGLERHERTERDGYLWYTEIADHFDCECGKISLDATSIKRNLHGILGQRTGGNRALGYVPLYEKNSLENTLREFWLLITRNPREEEIQQFIQNNTILLHQFPARKILFKPRILNKYVADFAVLTAARELVLIEIETVSRKLVKKNGEIAAELNHAVSQVRDWLDCAEQHRHAVLDGLEFKKEEINVIRGVVIAGDGSKIDPAHLRKLRARWNNISILTYDDLYSALRSLVGSMDNL